MIIRRIIYGLAVRDYLYIYVKYKETIIYSLLHCFRPSPKAGTSHLRCHLAPVGLVAGVRDAFSSGKVIEWEK